MVYHRPCLTLHAHGKPPGAPKKLQPWRTSFVRHDAQPPPVAGETTSERRASPTVTPGHGPLPPGHHGSGGEGGPVWQWPEGGRQPPALRIRSTSRGQCLRGGAIHRSTIYLPVPPDGLWHSALGDLSYALKLSTFRNNFKTAFGVIFSALCKCQISSMSRASSGKTHFTLYLQTSEDSRGSWLCIQISRIYCCGFDSGQTRPPQGGFQWQGNYIISDHVDFKRKFSEYGTI